MNKNLRETYMRFVVFMISKRHWNSNDRLMLVTYLLMQDRIAEAATQLSRIDTVNQDGSRI